MQMLFAACARVREKISPLKMKVIIVCLELERGTRERDEEVVLFSTSHNNLWACLVEESTEEEGTGKT